MCLSSRQIKKRVAAVIQDQAGEDIWIYDLARGLRNAVHLRCGARRQPGVVTRRTQYCVQLEPKRAIRSLSKTGGCVGAEELLYADDVDKARHELVRRTASGSCTTGAAARVENRTRCVGSADGARTTGRCPETVSCCCRPHPPSPMPDSLRMATGFSSCQTKRDVELYVMPFPPPSAGVDRSGKCPRRGATDGRWRRMAARLST